VLLSLGLGASVPAPPGPAAARRLLSQARDAVRRGKLDEAFLLAQKAAAGQADDSEFVAAREVLRQRATLAHLQRAHAFAMDRHAAAAALEYRAALAVDPGSLDARQGLAAAYPRAAPPPTSTELRVRNAASPVEVQPAAGVRAFHLRGDVRQAIAQIAAAWQLKAYVANAVPARPVRLDVDKATFADSMEALHDVAGVDWFALDAHTLYFDTADQMHTVAPMAVRTFYVPWVSDGVALNEIANVVRTMLGVRQATLDTASRAITVRATPAQLDAAEQLLLDLHQSPGQVVLEVKIAELSNTAARQLGVGEPDQFTMFALGPLLAQLQGSNNLQQEILQLFESGGLNAVLNSGQLSPTQLAQAQATLSPLLQNPFAVFGGGATLMALSIPNATLSLNATSGRVADLENALLRATSGQSAELKIGQRFPIINATFSPISLSPAISQVIGNGSFIQPFPSFTYEDLGLDAKLTPHLSSSGALTLQVDLTIKGLTGVSSNNMPILSNRHLVTEVGLKNGEPVLMAGLFDRQEMTTLSGLPGLAQLPGVGRLFSTQSGQTMLDQLVLIVTPHVVQLPPTRSAALWLPASFAPVNAAAANNNFINPATVAPGQRLTVPGGPPAPPGGGGLRGPGGGQP